MSASQSTRRGPWRLLFSTDHKDVGQLFLWSSLALLALGGALALAIRHQLAWPWDPIPLVEHWLPGSQGVLTPEAYTVLFTMHGTVMVFFVVIPLLTGAFGNFLIPLQIGARDMAFPRLNLLAWWLLVPGSACLLLSFLAPQGAAGAGWTSYPPLATIASAAPGSNSGQTWWLGAVLCAVLSSVLGGINYVSTVLCLRAPGLSMLRLPLSVWGLFLAALLQLFALPVLTGATLMQFSDRLLGSSFFTPQVVVNGVAVGAVGGEPLLWQHLFWFYSHPAVYVMVLPAMGLISDVLSTHLRRPIFGYRGMVYSMCSICLLGFLVWGHHMFTSGMSPALVMSFELSTLLIALPSGIKVFHWLATVWGARARITTALLFALGFLSMFIVGGLSGLWMAAAPVDVPLHDTYIVVAHFHYIVFGGSMLAVFAAVHHWFPKWFGRALDERLGRIHFAGTLLATHAVFFLMHQLGLAGMPRRSADPGIYPSLQEFGAANRFISLAAFALAAWQLFFVANLLWTLLRKPRATDGARNPWRANGLEWETESPPPHGNFDIALLVQRGPYEYVAREGRVDPVPQAAAAATHRGAAEA